MCVCEKPHSHSVGHVVAVSNISLLVASYLIDPTKEIPLQHITVPLFNVCVKRAVVLRQRVHSHPAMSQAHGLS